ncbi:MAG: response regulator [Bdellovibrionales bacterium]
MALRVLLADESSTIKKVFQLALQDYAVDVTSVALGTDVLQVARQFKPDIIFCDILLQKRNGYDVCADLKNDAQLKSLPVILMWSAFMELDEDKMQAAKADGNLEKPFEVQDLRALVNQFVAKTRSQRLGQFLNFPKMPEMVETPPPAQAQINSDGSVEPSGNWNMESFDPIPPVDMGSEAVEEFQEVPLPPPPKVDELSDLDEIDEPEREATQWSTKSLSRFQIQAEDEPAEQIAVSLPPDDASDEDVVLDLEMEDDQLAIPPPQTSSPEKRPLTGKFTVQPASNQTSTPATTLNEAQIEKMVREQAKAMIEAIAWKVVPDLATQIIERELQRLLAEKNP